MASCNSKACDTKSENKTCCGMEETKTCTTTRKYGNAVCDIKPGTRMYVGGRYMPKFHDPIAWTADVPYEAIEVVKHNGSTYISKKAVPAGVNIDNDEYWLLWADPNAQMEELRQLVESFNDRIDENETDIENANEKIIEIENSIKTITDNTIIPTCLGYVVYNSNYTSYDHPGAICEIEGRQVVISSPQNQSNNDGTWRYIDVAENRDYYDNAITAQVGHANSICSNGSLVLVAPVYKWIGGVRQSANCVYLFSTNGVFIRQIDISGANVMGVSYDHITKKWYVCQYYGIISEIDIDSGEINTVANVDIELPYNQDFAIYNGEYFISAPNGHMVRGILGSDTLSYITAAKFDMTGKIPNLGELDGMEFTPSGELLCLYHMDNSAEQTNVCFVCSLPVNYGELAAKYCYPVDYSSAAYTQHVEGHNQTLRPTGGSTSPHKTLTIRHYLEPSYKIWQVVGDLTARLRVGYDPAMLIRVNDGVTLTLPYLYLQTELSISGTDQANLDIALPIFTDNTLLAKFQLYRGIRVTDLNAEAENRKWFTATPSGTYIAFGGLDTMPAYKISTGTSPVAEKNNVYISGLNF